MSASELSRAGMPEEGPGASVFRKGLNPAQEKAVSHGDGPALVLAGPGSGKTTVITRRVERLVREAGVPGRNILVITFTRAAAAEMRNRFAALTGQNAEGVTFGTFHSVFFRMLRAAYNYDASSILGEGERFALICELAAKLDTQIPDLNDFASAVLAEISLVKNNAYDIEHYYARSCSDRIFQQLYTAYDERLKSIGKLDYDDILTLTLELLSARPDILDAWQERWRYILIDEFQDINLSQYRTVCLLAKKHRNLFVVGDDDQSIYRFRGASPQIMLGFFKDFPDAKRITLNINYRSDANIVAASENLISHNKKRYKKHMKPSHRARLPITLKVCRDAAEQSSLLSQGVRKLINEGTAPEDIAVLFRTNLGARLTMDALMRSGVPFHMRDALPNLFTHWIALDILAYLKIVNRRETRADWLRILNRPNRYLKREAFQTAPPRAAGSRKQTREIILDNFKDYYRDKDWMLDRIDRLSYDLEIMERMVPYAAIHYIGNAMNYLGFLNDYAKERNIPPEDLIDVYEAVRESAKGCRSLDEWQAHIDEYTEKLKEQDSRSETKQEGVCLCTLHGAKGLEFPVVIIPDINEDNIPHSRAASDADLEEERRLFYVGITRAKKQLQLYALSGETGRKKAPSRFLAELDASLLRRKL